MKWLRVALTVSGELAEPVAELLSRHTPDGVSLTGTRDAAEPDERRVTVEAYLPVDGQLEERRRAIKEGLWHLSQIHPMPEARYRTIEDRDWSELWKQRWRPIEVGQRFLILPAWLPKPESDRLVVRMDPGMAFGTGTHPSTRLCLELLEELLEPGNELIDLGCGSGILSIAGILLGARRALAVDIEKDAVRATRSNAELNGVESMIEVAHGSLDEILSHELSGEADVIVANILAPVLEDLLRQGLAESVGPGSALLLGGVLQDQVDRLRELADEQDLSFVSLRSEADWRALYLKRNPPLE